LMSKSKLNYGLNVHLQNIISKGWTEMSWNSLIALMATDPWGLQCIWCPCDTAKTWRNDCSSVLQRGIVVQYFDKLQITVS
jgi:hypothetical protein